MKITASLGALALGASLIASSLATPTFAAEGYVGIAMPTKSSARWIDDGNNMVKQFEAAGYKVDLQYAEGCRRNARSPARWTGWCRRWPRSPARRRP